MIKKRIIAIVAILLSPLLAYAVTVPESITLILPTDSSEYTLVGTQNTFQSLTINSTTFEFSLSGGEELLITSAGKKNFTSTLAGSFECQTSQSVFSVSKPEGESAETVTITPSGSCTSGGGGGGGSPSIGSGGGGSGPTYSPSPAPTPAPAAPAAPTAASIQQQILAIQQKIASLQTGAPAGVPHAYGVFAREMDPGDKDDEVRRLQELLKTDPAIYPEGKVTGYYGPLTSAAVRKFQAKYGLPSVGRVGPKTMAKLNEIFGGTVPAPTPAPVVPPATPTPAPQANSAQIQAIQDQIKAIQAKLIQEQIKLIQEKINALK